MTEIKTLISKVEPWCLERQSSIRSCYCLMAGPKAVVFFAPSSNSFDFDLADELVQLNTDLHDLFKVVDIHQVPFSDIDRFLDVQKSTLIYGEEFLVEINT